MVAEALHRGVEIARAAGASMRRIATADIGGTHARFAHASVDNGKVTELRRPLVLRTNALPTFEAAWEEFGRQCGQDLPAELAIAVAGPVGAQAKLTNASWVLDADQLRADLGLDRCKIINDLAAVAHALPELEAASFLHLCGPDRPLEHERVVTVIGAGTGLGAAVLVKKSGSYEVVETEAGHIGFAPVDDLDAQILETLRAQFDRVSVERILSGPGLLNIYQGLAASTGLRATIDDDQELWTVALAGTDRLAEAALERFCMCFGAVAGDLALAHGATAVVLGGGLGQRLSGRLLASKFADRFVAKGRFARHMADVAVKVVTYPEPGLLGAAVALVRESRS